MKSLSPAFRQQLIQVLAGAKVREGGIDPTAQHGPGIPPFPAPDYILSILPKGVSATSRHARDRALEVFEVFVFDTWGFAQVTRPLAEGAFRLSTGDWATLRVALDKERAQTEPQRSAPPARAPHKRSRRGTWRCQPL